MKTSAVRFAAGLVFALASAPFPACAQFIYPPVLVVPPPQDYRTTSRPKPPPDKPKPADTPPQTSKGGHFEGRTWVPD